MPSRSSRHEKVHGLLPWQLYALAGMTGLFAAQYLAPALAMFVLLLLSVPREATWSCWRIFIASRWPFLLRSPCPFWSFWSFVTTSIAYAPLVLTFALAWLYAHTMMASVMVHPLEAQCSPDKAQALWITGKAERITGRIASVDGLPDQRLRIVLEDVRPVKEDVRPVKEVVRPAKGDANAPKNPLPLRVVWTWEKPDLAGIDDRTKSHIAHAHSLPMRPMVGQRICATLAIKPVDMLANPDSFDLVRFWAMKGVFYRAWSKGNWPEVTALSEARTDALWREQVRLYVDDRLQALVKHGFAGIGRDGIDRDGIDRDGIDQPQHESNTTSSTPDNALRMSAASIVMGMLFGDRYYMDSDLLNYFARTDLLHTLALSGQHLIIAGFFASLGVFLLRYNTKTLLLQITTKKLYYLLSLPCVCFYLWLGNAPPSLVRASTMLVFWIILSCLSSRRATLPDALLSALVCILLISPLSVYDLGLQLSSIAVTSLGVSFVIAQHCLHYFRPQSSTPPITLSHSLLTPLAAFAHRILYAILFLALSTMAIQLALAPIQLMTFGTASPWFFMNILWIPVADLFVLPLIFLGLIFHATPDFPFLFPLHILGDVCFWFAMQACQLITMLLESMAHAHLLDYPALWRPHWTTAIGYGGLLVCMVARLGRPRLPSSIRRLALASLALFLTGFILMAKDAYAPHLRLTVFDVGMGQALYIRTPDNTKIMVDGGGFTSKRFDTGRDIVARALTHNQWPRLDMVLNTHPDNDHLRGLIHLLRAFPVRSYGYNGDDNAKDLYIPLHDALAQASLRPHTFLAGDVIDLGSNLFLEVLHPQEAKDNAGNDASLVTRLVYAAPNTAPNAAPKGLAMLCGDVEAKGLRALLRRADALNLDLSAEVLILPHHGAKGSYLPAFYDAVQPRIAIASCAKNHHYGYPNKAIRHDLAKRNIPLLYTGQHGALYIDWNELHEDGVLSWEGK